MASKKRTFRVSSVSELVYFWLAGIAVVLVVAVGARIFLGDGSPSSEGQPAPAQPQAGKQASATSAPASTYAARSFSSPVIEPSRGSANEAPWKGRYPKDVLVQAKALANPDYVRRFRVLDVCPRSQYETRHLPGALWVDYDAWTNAFRNNRDLHAWEQKIGGLGIDVDTPVVVYDNGSGQESAYIRSLLLYWGVKDVRVLDGGWPAWLFQGAYHEAAELEVAPRPCRLSPNPALLPATTN